LKFGKVNWIGWFSAIVATVLGKWVIPESWGIMCLTCLILGVVLYIVIAIACDKAGAKMDLGEHTIDKTGA